MQNEVLREVVKDMEETTVPLSGRRAEAARNDKQILDAARAVFFEDPEAPIAAVAKRARVGIGALYRRYGSKDELLQRLADDGLRRYIAEVTAALAAQDAPWVAFIRFMQRCVAIGTGSLSVRLAVGAPCRSLQLNRGVAPVGDGGVSGHQAAPRPHQGYRWTA
jgi:AcrR family transcriptional regulator